MALRKESAGDKSDDSSGRASNEDAEQRTLICLRCEDDRADKACEKTGEADDDSPGDAVGKRGAASGCFITWHSI